MMRTSEHYRSRSLVDSKLAQQFLDEFALADGPYYQRITRLIASLVARGTFQPGDVLPPQRELAKLLRVDLTTVTRGYGEAQALGLTAAKRGQGTFVALTASPDHAVCATPAAQVIDVSLVWPPNQQLIHSLATQSRQLLAQKAFGFLGQRTATTKRDLEAGQHWLKQRLVSAPEGVVVVASGTRNALVSILTCFDISARTLMIEESVWPTVRIVAKQVGITCVPVPMDEGGFVLDQLEAVSHSSGAKYIYCCPNLHNPTSRTMSLRGRIEFARKATELGLTIIEDDVYGRLLSQWNPALYDVAPGHVYHIAGLSKCISPSLRVAYVACPSVGAASQLAETLRLSMQAPSPFESALAARMVLSGTADELIAGLREETQHRQILATRLLERFRLRWHKQGMFIQLLLPAEQDEVQVREALLRAGVKVAIGMDFGSSQEKSLRIATGSVSRDELHTACTIIARTLSSPPQGSPLSTIELPRPCHPE